MGSGNCMFLLFILLSLLVTISYQYTHPDILWDPRNPIFDQEKCTPESRQFYAKPDDQFCILCGNPELNNGFQENSMKKRNNDNTKYNYNIYLTNKKTVHETRNSSLATLIYHCTAKPFEAEQNFYSYMVLKKKISLSPFQIGNVPGFEGGQSYWFFTTSDGTKESLRKVIGDRNSMSVEVKICKPGESCQGRERLNFCDKKSPNSINSDSVSYDDLPQKAQPQTAESGKGSPFLKPEVTLSILFAVIIGIIIGALMMYGRSQCKSKAKNTENPEESKHSWNGFNKKAKRQCSSNSQAPMLASQESEDGPDGAAMTSVEV